MGGQDHWILILLAWNLATAAVSWGSGRPRWAYTGERGTGQAAPSAGRDSDLQ